MLRLKKQLSFGIFGILFGTVGWLITDANIKITLKMGNYSMSPKTFPKFVLAVSIISGIMLVLQSLIKKDDEIVEINLKEEIPVAVYFLVLLVYYFLFKKIGFIITSIAASCIYLFLNRCRKKLYYAIVIALTVILYVVFTYAFKLSLPLGWPLNLIL